MTILPIVSLKQQSYRARALQNSQASFGRTMPVRSGVRRWPLPAHLAGSVREVLQKPLRRMVMVCG